MEGQPSINVLVQDKFTKQSQALFRLDDESLVLSFHGRSRNLHNDIEEIEQSVGSKLDPIILDLYNIALVVYVWDITTYRSGTTPRDFRCLISVSNVDRWNSVKPLLEWTFRFLTGDTFAFNFVQGQKPSGDFVFKKDTNEQKCVLLFSGGLDSLAGFKWSVDRKMSPMLVSHPGAGIISDAQGKLVEALEKIIQTKLQWNQIRATAQQGKDLQGAVPTQFSRSFLYLTLGAIFALKLGIAELHISENGVLAHNIPLTQARIYSSTRTVHPQFLKSYQEILDRLYGNCITVSNPFVDKTKGEVVTLLNSDGYKEQTKTTISCSEVQALWRKGVKISKIRHCGICFPCIIRRVAMNYAGLSDQDARYADDIELPYTEIPNEGRKLLFEMADFARQIDKCSNVDEALNEFPQFYIEGVDPAMLFDMAKRQVAQFKDFLRQRAHQTLRVNLGLP
jgi:7-cyano-7-deazaguanine synthase in queuosine biosynthesis